jgi:phospholipid/cholesterol/gamma-HCH transport system substrate-binding protein
VKSDRAQLIRLRINGLIMIALVALLVFLVIGAFAQLFTPFDKVTLMAPRSGLQMQSGNLVKMRGIEVGKVKDVRLADSGQGAVIDLNIEPDMIDQIPSNARTDLFQLTAFGNKYVAFSDPTGPAAAPLRDGSVVTADMVSTEANSLFSTLQRVLSSVNPADVNRTLGAVSTALQGNGDKIGSTITQASDYLAKLNTNLPTIQRDLRQTADFSSLFADVAPDLLHSIDNLTQTGRTVIDKQDQLNLTLVRLSTLGDDATTLLKENEDALPTALHILRPTTSLLNKYSPMLTCFIQGVDRSNRILEPILGAGKDPGADTSTLVQPAVEPYQNPRDLARITQRSGPNCYGLPNFQGSNINQLAPHNDATYPADAQNSFLYTSQNPFSLAFFGSDIFNQPATAAAGQGGGN